LHFAAAANAALLKGRLASARGDHREAVRIADRAIEWVRRLEVRPYTPAALLLKGTALLALGEPGEAETALLEGRLEAERLGFGPVLWRIDGELSGIAAERGDAPRAGDLLDEAKGLIEQIAATIGDPELRSSFLGLPEVEAVRST
jgi:tetratricopeptide (TPR) repeat protein